ncbi:I12R2 protein, partial [Serilophus lunatus]|nr:I12R2 protein [Serilophus lunatus]
INRTFPVTAQGKHTYTCKTHHNEKTQLICGIDVACGNPPDEPGNVSCIQKGRDGHPICTWDKGRLTHIDTTYEIQ